MSKIQWDQAGQKRFENGNDHGVLYNVATGGKYRPGVAWNGLTAVTESPDGAEANDLYADNIKYASLRSAETFGATIEAYMYPDEFAVCDGSAEVTTGVKIGQQKREAFGFSYRTNIGNDLDNEAGYKIHLIYNATASPSEKGYETINDSPDAITFSWEVDTTAVDVGTIGGVTYKPTSTLEIDSTKFTSTEDKQKLADFEDVIYGTDGEGQTSGTDALLPSPADVIKYFNGTLTKAQLIEAADPT
jgi:hypothetical protein